GIRTGSGSRIPYIFRLKQLIGVPVDADFTGLFYPEKVVLDFVVTVFIRYRTPKFEIGNAISSDFVRVGKIHHARVVVLEQGPPDSVDAASNARVELVAGFLPTRYDLIGGDPVVGFFHGRFGLGIRPVDFKFVPTEIVGARKPEVIHGAFSVLQIGPLDGGRVCLGSDLHQFRRAGGPVL